jgi:aminopeptidase YwaD
MSKRHALIAAAILALTSASAHAQTPSSQWQVKQEWVAAHEAFLAGDALRGRGSATPDEGVAAAYVAAMFQSYGLQTAPGMTSYLQTASVTTTSPSSHTTLTAGGLTLTQGSNMTILLGSGRANAGAMTLGGADPAAFPAAEVMLIAPPEGNTAPAWINAAAGKGANLVIIRETDFLKSRAASRPPRASTRLT